MTYPTLSLGSGIESYCVVRGILYTQLDRHMTLYIPDLRFVFDGPLDISLKSRLYSNLETPSTDPQTYQ